MSVECGCYGCRLANCHFGYIPLLCNMLSALSRQPLKFNARIRPNSLSISHSDCLLQAGTRKKHKAVPLAATFSWALRFEPGGKLKTWLVLACHFPPSQGQKPCIYTFETSKTHPSLDTRSICLTLATARFSAEASACSFPKAGASVAVEHERKNKQWFK